MAAPNADTIAAVATAQGLGGIGIVRISGRDIRAVAAGILGRIPVARHATYANFIDDKGDTLDQGIALYFPAPHSYTGEEVLELQGHGGPAVLHMVLQRCIELGARLAEPGEFTRRAYLNNRMDLAQAESVADLIAANSSAAARSALRSLSGEFSSVIHQLVDSLIHLRMLVEAMLNFPEEELDGADQLRRDTMLEEIRNQLQHTLDTARLGSLLREGAHIVIAGRPNVGKSSLLNRLSGEEAALVSSIPGTTRDLIRQQIQLQGVPLHIIDTAGLRKSDDVVENMGIERTQQTLHRADLILLVLDASQGITEQDQTILDELPDDIPHFLVFNKDDLVSGRAERRDKETAIHVSAKTGAGLEELRAMLLKAVGWRAQESGVFMARERHLRALQTAQKHLQLAHQVLPISELFAEELRLAQRALSQITGEFTEDDLLGEIFSRFCIGK